MILLIVVVCSAPPKREPSGHVGSGGLPDSPLDLADPNGSSWEPLLTYWGCLGPNGASCSRAAQSSRTALPAHVDQLCQLTHQWMRRVGRTGLLAGLAGSDETTPSPQSGHIGCGCFPDRGFNSSQSNFSTSISLIPSIELGTCHTLLGLIMT